MLRRMVGPFIFMDHAGPILEVPEELSSLDVLPHPHIGLSTVSYLFDGHSQLFYLHVALKAGTRFGLPKEYSERSVYIVNGNVEISGSTYPEGLMLVFDKGVDPVISAKTDVTLMLLGGEPLGERYIWWNFVSSRKERIEKAKEDWKQGRIILPPSDNDEFIPLPEEKNYPAGRPPRPEPLS